MKALEKDRARRYETANGLARDVQRYLADEPVEACPPSAGYRLRKFARRYRNALATAAAFVLLLALAAAVSTWQAVRATRAERAERAERDRAVAAEMRAKTEQANARAALDFLWKDVLSQASYRNEPDRDLTVRTLLDRVADRLGRGPGQSPLVDAAVRQMVGSLYIDLGEYRKAQPHLESGPGGAATRATGRRTRRPWPPCTTSVTASIVGTGRRPPECLPARWNSAAASWGTITTTPCSPRASPPPATPIEGRLEEAERPAEADAGGAAGPSAISIARPW